MQYKIEYITFKCHNNDKVSLMVPLPEKLYPYDNYVKNWLKGNQASLFCTDATTDIIEYLETLKIGCCYIYPEIIRKEKGLIVMSATGALLNTAIDIKIQDSLL